MATVQRGLISLTGTTTTSEITLGTSVAVGESFVVASVRSNSGDAEKSFAKVELTTVSGGNYTKLKATRDEGGTGHDSYIEWQVITGEEFTVQSGETDVSGGTVTESITQINQGEAFITLSYSCQTGWTDYAIVASRFSSNSQVELKTSTSTTTMYSTAKWYVVEWDGADVQYGIVVNGLTDTETINEVNRSKSFLTYTHRTADDAGYPNRTFSRGRISSNTEVEFKRSQGTFLNHASYFIVSHDLISVQYGTKTITGTSTTTTLTSAVNVGESFMPTPIMGNAHQDTDSNYSLHHAYNTHRLYQSGSDSRITVQRSVSDNSLYASWFVVEILDIVQPSVSTLSSQSISDSSATIRGEITNTGGENPTRYLQWGTNTNMTSSANKGVGGTGIYTHDLTSLDPATKYYFRAYATNDAGTGYGTMLDFTTDKGDQAKPSAPTMHSRTQTSITLNTLTGGEYRRNGGSWQDSTTFSGLSVGTSYSFTQRLKETSTHNASPESDSASFSTEKGDQAKPSAPTMYSRTSTSITLNSISNGEYRRGSMAWQDSTTFSGLSKGTQYSFTQRYKETSTHYASPISASGTFNTVDYPSVSTLSAQSITSSSATIRGDITNTGGEDPTRYLQWGTTTNMTSSANKGVGGTGTYTHGLSGLDPGKKYYFRAYATNDAGTTQGTMLDFTTNKVTQSAPSAPTLSSRTGTSITLNSISNGEYRRGSGAWQDSTTFSGLSRGTSYSFTQRYKETETHYASPASSSANFTTIDYPSVSTLSAQSVSYYDATIRGDITNTGGENPTRYIQWGTNTSMTSSANKGTSGTGVYTHYITGLSPATKHYFRAYATNVAGTGWGTMLDFTTDKAPQDAPSPPTLNRKTEVSITLNSISNGEYRRGSGAWQDSTIFSGLSPNQSYSFTQRYKETATHLASPASNSANFSTLPVVSDNIALTSTEVVNVDISIDNIISNDNILIECVETTAIYANFINNDSIIISIAEQLSFADILYLEDYVVVNTIDEATYNSHTLIIDTIQLGLLDTMIVNRLYTSSDMVVVQILDDTIIEKHAYAHYVLSTLGGSTLSNSRL